MHPIGRPDPGQRTEVHGFDHSEEVLPGARDRRLVHRMLYFWGALRGGEALPSIDDLDTVGMPEDWRQCFLLARSGPAGGYVFDHLGGGLADDCAGDISGDMSGGISAVLPESLLDHAIRPIPLVARDRVPVTTGGAFRRSGRVVRFRSILLPFEGRASGAIYLLGAANSRAEQRGIDAAIEDLSCYKFERGVWVLARLPASSRVANDA